MERGETAAVLLVLFLLANSLSVNAIGLRAEDLKLRLVFKPGLEKEIGYTIVTNAGITMDYHVSVEGDLAEYVTLSQSEFKDVKSGEYPKFTAIIRLPDEIERPGIHEIGIIASEASSRTGEGSSFGIKTSTRARILIDVPYPEKYAEMRVDARDVKVDEPIRFTVSVKNRGKQDILSAYAKLALYTKEGKMIRELETPAQRILSQETGIFEGKIYTEGESITISPGVVHRMEGVEDSIYLEASTPEMDDVVRLVDDYERD
jgi:hypothetical protein